MMFMVSGRAVNANGSPIVRDGLVAAIHDAGHSIVTAQPRRGSYAYVDYLVATVDSIRRRVTKVRWAAERGIRVISYQQMWRLINNNIEPEPARLPQNMEAPPRRATSAQHYREANDRAARQSLADERETMRLRQAAREEAIAAAVRARDEQRVTEMQREAEANAPPLPGERQPETKTEIMKKVAAGPPRRRIVTSR